MLPEHINLIRKVGERLGVTNGEVDYEPEKGGHYMGVITPVALRDKTRVINLILKTAQRDEEVRKKRAIVLAFEREFEFYEKILPALLKFQENYGLSNPFKGAAKYYGGINLEKKEAIVIENLVSSGFKVWNSLEPLDFNDMALIVREYAAFHVISLGLRQKYPKQFENLTKNIKLNFLDQREKLNPDHFKKLTEAILGMGHKAVLGNLKAEKAYKKFEEGYPDFWANDKKKPERDVVVVSHGDCHVNNILFKCDGTTVCFIDWQLSALESPIHDLSFVLCACASKEALLRSEELFQIYHNVITQSLKEFGCDPEKVLSYQTLTENWQKHFFHGLYRAQTNLKLTLMTEEEFADLGEATSILDTIKKDFAPDSKFAQRMKDLYEVVGKKWL